MIGDIDTRTLQKIRKAKDELQKQRVANEVYNEIYNEEVKDVDNRLAYIAKDLNRFVVQNMMTNNTKTTELMRQKLNEREKQEKRVQLELEKVNAKKYEGIELPHERVAREYKIEIQEN